jgi:hypothetical protein
MKGYSFLLQVYYIIFFPKKQGVLRKKFLWEIGTSSTACGGLWNILLSAFCSPRRSPFPKGEGQLTFGERRRLLIACRHKSWREDIEIHFRLRSKLTFPSGEGGPAAGGNKRGKANFIHPADGG